MRDNILKVFGLRLISSQCGEDLIIESIIHNKVNGVYVDVGANHPIKFNNTFLFYKKGWRGINIKPNPERILLFKFFRRKDTNLNIGISKDNLVLDFYVFKESTLSTFDTNMAKKYQDMGHKLRQVKQIKTLSLKEVFDRNLGGKEIDFMSIDTEGFDMQVLESNEWNLYRPRFIILETLEYRNDNSGNKLNDIYDPYMKNLGYQKIADTHINTIYEKNN